VAQTPADDDAISREVTAAIERATEAAAAVQVRVEDGVVTLQGTVCDEEERSAVECATWDAHGVVQVRSHLHVASGEIGDSAVSEALSDYVTRAMNVPPGQIVVQYRSGIVSLAGTVTSAAQAEAIEDLLRWHDRVIDVVSHLRVGTAEPLAGRAS
jgi:osmotically-inducible protein OsmY